MASFYYCCACLGTSSPGECREEKVAGRKARFGAKICRWPRGRGWSSLCLSSPFGVLKGPLNLLRSAPARSRQSPHNGSALCADCSPVCGLLPVPLLPGRFFLSRVVGGYCHFLLHLPSRVARKRFDFLCPHRQMKCVSCVLKRRGREMSGSEHDVLGSC